MRVFFTHLGCKLNQAEIDHLARQFLAAGHVRVGALDDADLHVINSCTVTHLAARDSRKVARRGQRLNPQLKTVLTGCYASAEPATAAALDGVDLVVTNDRKDHLLELVHQTFPEAVPEGGEDGPLPIPYVPLDFGTARALVKVEDGCNMRCSFCIIPSTRGRQRSRPLADVVAEVRALCAGGYPEIVVTGVQISEYRAGEERLYDLVKAILDQTRVRRLRLTSIAPWKFDDRLLDLWADRRLCRHIHMSLQSGSTATLRRMRRPYSAERYRALIERVRAAIPGVAITTDVIVGFPGETAQEHAESLAFVAGMRFARPHIFTYSARRGTRAASLPDHVPHEEKKTRVAEMLAVARHSELAFWQEHLGSQLEVAWEDVRHGRWSGLTDNYIRVFTNTSQDLQGRLTPVVLETIEDGGVNASLTVAERPPRRRDAANILAEDRIFQTRPSLKEMLSLQQT